LTLRYQPNKISIVVSLRVCAPNKSQGEDEAMEYRLCRYDLGLSEDVRLLLDYLETAERSDVLAAIACAHAHLFRALGSGRRAPSYCFVYLGCACYGVLMLHIAYSESDGCYYVVDVLECDPEPPDPPARGYHAPLPRRTAFWRGNISSRQHVTSGLPAASARWHLSNGATVRNGFAPHPLTGSLMSPPCPVPGNEVAREGCGPARVNLHPETGAPALRTHRAAETQPE
jgi:hypothetical protein